MRVPLRCPSDAFELPSRCPHRLLTRQDPRQDLSPPRTPTSWPVVEGWPQTGDWAVEETEFEVLTPLAPSIRDQHSGRLVRKAVGTGLFIPFC